MTATAHALPPPRETFATMPQLHAALGDSRERMIAIQSEAYPASWSEADRREVSVLHLFGEQGSVL